MNGFDRGTSLFERQLRIIGQVSDIDDPDLLARLERMIDVHNSGLRVLDDAESAAILDELHADRSD